MQIMKRLTFRRKVVPLLAKTSVGVAILTFGIIVTGCAKADPSAPRLTNVQFDVSRTESPLDSAARIADQLRPQLARQLGGNEPIVFGRQLLGGELGARVMAAAVTPTGGAFAIIPVEPFAQGKGTVPVCWFEIRWPAPNAAQSAAGLYWAIRLWPDKECKTLKPYVTTWERDSAEAGHRVTLRRGNAIIVTEGKHLNTYFPPDLRAVMRAALRPGEELVRIAPLPVIGDTKAFGWTSRGRTLFAVGYASRNACVADAPSWADVSKTKSTALAGAERACEALLDEAHKADMEELEADPQPIQVVPFKATPKL